MFILRPARWRIEAGKQVVCSSLKCSRTEVIILLKVLLALPTMFPVTILILFQSLVVFVLLVSCFIHPPVKFFVRENNHHVLYRLLRTLNLETKHPQNFVSGFLGSHLRRLSKYRWVEGLSQLHQDSTWIARPVQWADETYQAVESIIIWQSSRFSFSAISYVTTRQVKFASLSCLPVLSKIMDTLSALVRQLNCLYWKQLFFE